MSNLKRPNNVKTPLLLVLILVLIILPFVVSSSYYLYVAVLAFIYLIVSQTFRFMTLDGDWSFAHVIIMAVGSYTSGLLMRDLGWAFIPSMIAAAFVALAIALIIYPISLRTRGVTYFWVTWALGEIVRQAFAQFKNPFGGVLGLRSIPRPEKFIFGLQMDFTSQMPYYYCGLVLVCVVFFVLYLMEKSRIGLTLKSINQNWQLAESVGINVYRWRLLAVIVPSFFAGICGSFYAHWIQFITPHDFDLTFGFLVLLYVVVGGTRTMWGTVIGVVTFILLQQVLTPLREYVYAVYGLILMLTLGFLPGGLESLPERIKSLKIFTTKQKIFTMKQNQKLKV